MRKKFHAVVAGIIMLISAPFALTACSTSTGEGAGGDDLYEGSLALKDGRTVTCVVNKAVAARGGLSCDWAGAK